MTRAEINTLIRPYLVKQQRERRKRQLLKWFLSGLTAFWVACFLWFIFLVTFKP